MLLNTASLHPRVKIWTTVAPCRSLNSTDKPDSNKTHTPKSSAGKVLLLIILVGTVPAQKTEETESETLTLYGMKSGLPRGMLVYRER